MWGELVRQPRAGHSALSDEVLIDLVYTNVLGRLPDSAGRAFWVDQSSMASNGS